MTDRHLFLRTAPDGGEEGKIPSALCKWREGSSPTHRGTAEATCSAHPTLLSAGVGGVFTPLPGGVGKPGSVNNQTVQVQDPRHDGEVLTAAGTSLPGQWTLAISHGLMSKGQGGEHI